MSVLPRIALFLQYVLPRIAQIFTEPSCCIFSHGLHSSLCSPTEFTEYTEPSCCMFSHRLHRFSQIGSFRGCTCLKCTNPFVVALLALLMYFLLCWCT